MARAYYNDIDPHAVAWLKELITAGLIAPGDVDGRSITEVQPQDLDGYTQCHFFAGIGGWSYALRLAGWPDDRPCWTGSLPCQPFSVAGKGLGTKDKRHLWPEFARLIEQRSAPTIFGEQVASKAGRTWLATVRTDLEDLGYAVGAADLCAAGTGAPHIRQRLWWVAHAIRERGRGGQTYRQYAVDAGTRGEGPGLSGIYGRVAAEPQPRPLVDGIPARVASLRGYGNAVVPQVAQAFIESYLDVLEAA